ncbi:MAG: hypothetical protein ACLFWB_01755, partial [Armatimonadota bacterium]
MRIFDENNQYASLVRTGPDSFWAMWNTWRDRPTQVLVTHIGPEFFTPMELLSERDGFHVNPAGAASNGVMRFFWLEINGGCTRVMTRVHDGEFGDEKVLS